LKPKKTKEKKMRYIIKSGGKETISIGKDARDAFERYANRRFFGNERLHPTEYRLEQMDADTRGREWASYWIRGEERALVTRADNECKKK
jgi:hypothetical protein